MPIFNYIATDAEGLNTNGNIEAVDKSEAISFLEKKKLVPTKVELEKNEKRSSLLNISLFDNVRPLDRILLVRNLALTLKAGLNIVEAIGVLTEDATKKVMKGILNHMKFGLERGQALSDIFAYYQKYFPPIFVGLVKAGENSGQLDKSLEELADQLTKEQQLVRKVKSAMAYPALLLVASLGVIILLMVFVIPRLTNVFATSGVELPTITKFFVAISKAITYSPILDLFILVFLVSIFTIFRRTDSGKKFFLTLGFHIPVVSNLLKKIALVRFTRTLSGLIGSGSNILEALELSAQAASNRYYTQAILSSLEQIKKGIPLSEAIQKEPKLFPRLLVNMVAVGEKTGTLNYVLKTFSDFYEEEVDNTLKDLTTFLEPILLLLMGLMIGAIALAVLLPIYQLVSKFS